MSLAPLSDMFLFVPGRLRRGARVASLLLGLLALMPAAARADEACTLKCAQRQNTCAANCAEGERCRQHCTRSADTCFVRCQKSEDAREVARQGRAQKLCTTPEGRERQCTAAEARQLREDMDQASKFLCRDKKGELTPCPDQLKQLEEAKKLTDRECPGGTCKDDGAN